MIGAAYPVKSDAENGNCIQHHDYQHVEPAEISQHLGRDRIGPRPLRKLCPGEHDSGGKDPEARNALLHEKRSREIQAVGTLPVANLISSMVSASIDVNSVADSRL